MRDKIRFDAYKELKIVNIESLFFAFLLGFTLIDNGLSPIAGVAAGLVSVLVIKFLFRFKIGYFLVSTVFSGFWAIAFSSRLAAGWELAGWRRSGAGHFAACLYGHQLNYEEEKNREDD